MRCAVCGRTDAKKLTTIGGQHLGHACAEVCTGLLWESHFVRATGGTEYDHALILWQWKARAADVNGIPFREPMPESPDEKTLTAWASSRVCGVEASGSIRYHRRVSAEDIRCRYCEAP